MKACTLNYNMEWTSYGKNHDDIHACWTDKSTAHNNNYSYFEMHLKLLHFCIHSINFQI